MAFGNAVMRGINGKPVASEILGDLFESLQTPQGGQLFIGYPVTTAIEEGRSVDAVFVAPQTGVVVFDLVEGTDIGDYESRQDRSATALEVRLKQVRELMDRRDLLVPIRALTFAPAVAASVRDDDGYYEIANAETLAAKLQNYRWPDSTQELYRRTVSSLQSMSGIRRSPSSRTTQKPRASAKSCFTS